MARALLFFFVSPVWPAWWLALALAAAEVQGEGDCSPKPCGKVSISFPFGLVLEQQAEEIKCGSFGFQVRCTNNTPYLGYYPAEYRFQILDIFYGNDSLLVSDINTLDDLISNSSHEGCHVPTSNTSSKVWPPFSISPVNQNLIFYNCTKASAPEGRGMVETRCRGADTFVRAEGHYDETSDYGTYSLEACNATVVPVLGASGKVNASNYEELISDGFLLTWQRPPESGDPSIQEVYDAEIAEFDV